MASRRGASSSTGSSERRLRVAWIADPKKTHGRNSHHVLVGWLVGWLFGWLVGLFFGCEGLGGFLGFFTDPLRSIQGYALHHQGYYPPSNLNHHIFNSCG